MAATLSAVFQEDGRFVVITLAGTGSTMEVVRLEPGGTEVELRGSRFTLSGGQGIAYDYEAPFDVPVSYRGISNGETGYSGEVTVESNGEDWLRSLSNPSRSVVVSVQDFAQKDSAGRVSLYQVHGRRLPVAVTDVMTAFTGTINLYAAGSDVNELHDLIRDGYPIMLHTPPAHGEDRFYFVVLGAKWSRVARLADDPGRTLTLEVAEVDSSRLVLGVSPQQYTWDELASTYGDWDAVQVFDTWRDITLAGLSLPGV